MTKLIEPYGLPTAEIIWQGDQPRSILFDDIYFSDKQGLAESEYVFIQQNNLATRFASWQQERPFVIGEIGFGSGLNFLAACHCFLLNAPLSARLNVIGYELYPLTIGDLTRILAPFNQLDPLRQQLIAQWPTPISGVHRLILSSRITLDLHFGDASICLAQTFATVDAWFLDGFAPAKNPQLWSTDVLAQVSRLSAIGTTLATFTSAAPVKKKLVENGFIYEKIAGFGHKRHMLRAQLISKTALSSSHKIWFTQPSNRLAYNQRITIIGAGISGACTAYALARRGYQIDVYDNQGIAQGASGNPQGALHIRLALNDTADSRFYFTALLFSRRWLKQLALPANIYSPCGNLVLAQDSQMAQQQLAILTRHQLPSEHVRLVTQEELAKLIGCDSQNYSQAIFYSDGGWLNPSALCQRLLAHNNITLHSQAISHFDWQSSGWQLTLDDHSHIMTEALIIAAGWQSQQFSQTAHLPLLPLRGQITQLALRQNLADLRCVVHGQHYLIPSHAQRILFGATFQAHQTNVSVQAEDNRLNWQYFAKELPQLSQKAFSMAKNQLFDGRCAIRAATPDRLPFVGAAPNAEQWQQAYTKLRFDRHYRYQTKPQHWPNLWLHTGLNAKGLVSAPLSAELLASQICAEPLPLPQELIDHLNPGRRIIADLIHYQKPA